MRVYVVLELDRLSREIWGINSIFKNKDDAIKHYEELDTEIYVLQEHEVIE